MKPSVASSLAPERRRAEIVDGLRRLLPRLENPSAGKCAFSFDLPALDAHLPRGGLAGGALHEVVPETEGDLPAAFGFAAALLGRMPKQGPVLFVISARGLAAYRPPPRARPRRARPRSVSPDPGRDRGRGAGSLGPGGGAAFGRARRRRRRDRPRARSQDEPKTAPRGGKLGASPHPAQGGGRDGIERRGNALAHRHRQGRA